MPNFSVTLRLSFETQIKIKVVLRIKQNTVLIGYCTVSLVQCQADTQLFPLTLEVTVKVTYSCEYISFLAVKLISHWIHIYSLLTFFRHLVASQGSVTNSCLISRPKHLNLAHSLPTLLPGHMFQMTELQGTGRQQDSMLEDSPWICSGFHTNEKYTCIDWTANSFRFVIT